MAIDTISRALSGQASTAAKQAKETADSAMEQAISAVPGAVADWLEDNVTPTTPVVDASLSIAGAAADAKATGDEITDLKSAVKNSDEGFSSFALYGNFQHYGLNTNGTFKTDQKYRVSNDDPMTFDRTLTISVKSGFRWGYIPFTGTTPGAWSNWKTSSFSIPAGTSFVVQIARVTENTSEIADVSEFVEAVTFSTKMNDEIDIIENSIDNISGVLANAKLNVGAWEQGNVTETGEHGDSTGVRTGFISVALFNEVYTSCASGYKYYYLLYDSDKNYISASSFTTAPKKITIYGTQTAYIRVVLKHMNNSAITPEYGVNMEIDGQNAVSNVPHISNRLNVVENIFRTNHLFNHIGVNKTQNVIIPCQSLSDVTRTKRLGFDVLELNVLKTSDNNYICTHGNNGKFGGAFIGADQSDVSDISVSSKTLDWIKSNVRYVSNYPKYQTPPPSLEEMLYECKKIGIIPLVQFVDNAMISILDNIMGKDNYILNLYTYDRDGRSDAVCASWTAIADKDDAIAKCEASGQSYILGVNRTNAAFASFTDSDWKEYIEAVHSAGYYLAAAYTGNITDKILKQGYDAVASGAYIPDIDNGNICNLDSGADFSDFTITNGTVTNGTLSITNYGTVTPGETIDTCFLGGGSLHIRFNGKISVNMGGVAGSFESDGSSDTWISSVFENAAPSFTIAGDGPSGEVTIYDITYKASKM